MRKILLVFFLIAVVIGISSCSNILLRENKMGAICITVPIVSERAITNSNASSISNYYEIFVSNGTNYYTSSIIPGTSSTLSVPVGTYKVNVLAGYKVDQKVVLLGTGRQTNIFVIADQVTNIDMTLDSISFDFIVPTQVQASSAYNVTLSGDTKSPEVVPYYMYTNQYPVEFRIYGSNFNVTKQTIAPATPGTSLVQLTFGAQLFYKDGTIDIWLRNSSGGGWTVDWFLPDYANLQGTSLESEVSKTIQVLQTGSTTGISITIVWGT